MFTSFSIVCSWPDSSRFTTGCPVLSRIVSSPTLKLVLSWQERVWQPSGTFSVFVSTTSCTVLSCATSTLRLLLSSDERVWVLPFSTTGCPVLSVLTASSWKERVSISWERDVVLPSCAVLVLVPTTGCSVLSVLTTGCTILSWSGFGIGWFDWKLLDCCTTCSSDRWAPPEPNSLFQSCFREIFGGSRGDAYTFSYMTSPVSIRTTFGIQ